MPVRALSIPSIRSRRGISDLVSTLLALPLVILFIATVVYFGRALYLRAALEDTAAAGARWAATSLSGEKGCSQAREAMRQTIEGYYINPDPARISVTPLTVWGRGARARVSVEYPLDQSVVPILGPLFGPITVRVEYLSPIDSFNARHNYAWRACQ